MRGTAGRYFADLTGPTWVGYKPVADINESLLGAGQYEQGETSGRSPVVRFG